MSYLVRQSVEFQGGSPNWAKITGEWALCPGDSCCVLKRGESSPENFLSHPSTRCFHLKQTQVLSHSR